VLAKVAEVATYRNLRRGRQSFVMAPGFVAARQFADTVALFPSDLDVDGQVLDTLIRMKAPGYTREAISLLRSYKVWIRRLAKKYVERYSEP
jgi:RecG-like helicase